MPVETPSLFAQVIRDHLDLKERNSSLDRQMLAWTSLRPRDFKGLRLGRDAALRSVFRG